MPQGIQSIEDLIGQSAGSPTGDDDSAQVQFAHKTEEIKVKEMERLAERQADSLGASYVDLTGFSISPEALTLIDEEEAAKLSVVCFFYNGKDIRLGAVDYASPEVNDLLKKLEEKYHSHAVLYLISEHSLKHALDIYRALPKPRKIIRGINITEEDLNRYSEKFSSFKDVHGQIEAAEQVTDIVTVIMAAAIKTGASDVHIEVEEKEIKARFRIDGVLHDVAAIKKEMWGKIVLRFKILTKVKINISNTPQDGRMSIFMKDDRIDIRASFLPTAYGESIVMRLLRSSSVGLGFEQLGIRSKAFKQLKNEVERPNGMIITTGPTGSGKTTTLYAILKKLNNPETKIITIEDPIEYQLKGVNQSQTSEKYTFAQGLRSIVRQDPDIVMVGEIRDLETAEVSIQAALTGHLVLSTIHTNNAAGTVPRFLSMGAKPFLLAPALNAIIGQRLVRRVCEKCKREEKLDDEAMARIKEILEKLPDEEKKEIDMNNLKFYKGAGCDICQDIGYKGRIGIYEIMTVNKDIEEIILSGKLSEYDMAEVAAKNGMISMAQDGLLKAIDGITSVEEIFRVSEMKK